MRIFQKINSFCNSGLAAAYAVGGAFVGLVMGTVVRICRANQYILENTEDFNCIAQGDVCPRPFRFPDFRYQCQTIEDARHLQNTAPWWDSTAVVTMIAVPVVCASVSIIAPLVYQFCNHNANPNLKSGDESLEHVAEDDNNQAYSSDSNRAKKNQ